MVCGCDRQARLARSRVSSVVGSSIVIIPYQGEKGELRILVSRRETWAELVPSGVQSQLTSDGGVHPPPAPGEGAQATPRTKTPLPWRFHFFVLKARKPRSRSYRYRGQSGTHSTGRRPDHACMPGAGDLSVNGERKWLETSS